MPVHAVRQAECTECGESDDNYTITHKRVGPEDDEDEEPALKYQARCACGEKAAMLITEEGTRASSNVSYEDATWNEEESE